MGVTIEQLRSAHEDDVKEALILRHLHGTHASRAEDFLLLQEMWARAAQIQADKILKGS